MNTIMHSLVMVAGVVIASIAQVLLKKSSQVKHKSKINEYLNSKVILAYFMMISATLCTVFAYKVIPISLGMVLDSTGYVFVTIFGFIFFSEKINLRRLVALTMIISGIIVYATLG